MKIGRYATLRHYARHILPVWEALPDSVKVDDPKEADYVLVASWRDADRLPRKALIYVEHGAGQTYSGDGSAMPRGFAGAPEMGHVALFIVPNESVGAAWRRVYRRAQCAVVGCPALDRWHRDPPTPEPGLVAVTFHWHAQMVCEEATSAWSYYRGEMPGFVAAMRAAGGDVLGHEHPRWEGRLLAEWSAMGVETGGYDDVMDRAAVLVADNTSLIPEVASLGRPVVFVNSPRYRRNVWHGGRFWEWPNGQVVVDAARGLVPAVEHALSDPPDVRAARERMVEAVYAATDGYAAARAADAVLSLPENPRVQRRRPGRLMGEPKAAKTPAP